MRGPRRLAILLLVAALGAATVGPAHATAAPRSWDPRVRPIARAVEQLRGLRFEHAVPVEFLSDAAFEKRIVVDQGNLSAADKADVERSEAQLRSVGLLAGDVDLLRAVSSLQTSGVLAYYDPKTKRAVVRGKVLDAAAKVTLAHELTHGLQDQHFDLLDLQHDAERTHSADALKAVVEGDAVRVEDLYVDRLSAAEQAEYESERSAEAGKALAEVHALGVPDSLVSIVQSSYTLGPLMLDVVQAVGGDHAIDRLFRRPPAADSAYLTPSTLVDGSKLTKVAAPALVPGEEQNGKPDVFGAFALDLILSARSDPVAALAVADGWAGDSMVTFRRDGVTCLRATFAGRTKDAADKLAEALRQWAAQGASGAADVRRDGELTTLTACDPGVAGGEPRDASVAALAVAGVRNGIFASLVEHGVGVATASCTANGAVQDPKFRPLLDATVTDPNATPNAEILTAFQQRVAAIATGCAAAS